MIVDRHNYEEFFILYLDNELSDADRRLVEDFTQANPDLQEELNLLLQSKLSPDMDISFDNKEELMKLTVNGIDHNNYEEWLLLYTDNELTTDQKKAVENFVSANPEIGKELLTYQQTRFIADNEIIFKNKEVLYRHETKTRKIGFNMWRVAAAAILLIGLSTSVYMLVENKKQQEANSIANIESPATTSPAIVAPAGNEKSIAQNPVQETIETPAATSTSQQDEIITGNKQSNPAIKVTGNDNRNVVVRPNEQYNAGLASNSTVSPNKVGDNNTINNSIETNISDPIAKNDPLTNPTPNIQATTVTTGSDNSSQLQTPDPLTNDDVAGIDQSGKKNKFRGFFRKVTRTIEKTTNMKATDDEDRLLLAGLAIKL